MAARPPEGEDELVTVHLAEIPEARRAFVAREMIRLGGIEGTAAIELHMAAFMPRQNPSLEVTAKQRKHALRPGMRR